MTTTSGAAMLMTALRHGGVEILFGHPGGAMLPGYDALLDCDLRHVLARHEQGAGHMAEGYAQASGRPGVVMATSGPGATNLVTPLADAHLDSVPLLAITGQVGSVGIGREAFQEADVLSITAPVTKHSEGVRDPERIAPAILEALEVARSGRPGPVLVDIPKDVLAAPVSARELPPLQSAGSSPSPEGDPALVRRAAEALAAAQRPVLYVGGGVIKAEASAELRELADRLSVPVVTTLMARGAFPSSHPAHLGMPGMHGHWTATTAMQRADLIVSLGARFDDRVTADLDAFAPDAVVVHVDIDPVELGKNRVPDVGVVGDCRAVLRQLLEALPGVLAEAEPVDREPWWTALRDWQDAHPLRWEQPADGPLKPQTALRALGDRLGDDDIVVTGVGQHQMWAAQHLGRSRPRGWITSGGLGTMGFCLPAAVGAKAARPADRVIAVDGDGSLQMTVQELATARAERLPIVLVVLSNGGLGMVRQWQDLFYDGRRSQVGMEPSLPSMVRLAEAYGWVGLRCDDPAELDASLDKALSVEDLPVLLEVCVDPDEHVFPMVPSGGSNDVIFEAPDELEGAR